MDLFRKGASTKDKKQQKERTATRGGGIYGVMEKLETRFGTDADDKTMALRLYWSRFAIGIMLFVIGLFTVLPPFWRYVAHILSALTVGRHIFDDSLRRIRKKQPLSEKLLIAVAIIVSFIIGKSWQGAAIAIFYVTVSLLEDMLWQLAREYIKKKYRLNPGMVTVARDGQKETVPPESVAEGDIVVLSQGQMLAVDGFVVAGLSEIDMGAVADEDSRTFAEPGSEILSGCVNLGDELKIRASRSYADSYINKINMISDAAAQAGEKADEKLKRIMGLYVLISAVIAAVVGIIVPVLSPLGFGEWINRALVFLASAGIAGTLLSVPVAYFWAVNKSASQGIAVKRYDTVDDLAAAGTVMLAKTGVVTEGRFEIAGVVPMGITEKALLRYAAYTQAYSSHPMASAVISAYDGYIDASTVARYYEQPGKGVIVQFTDKNVVCAGNEHMMEDVGVEPADINTTENVLHLSLNRSYIGYILLNDKVNAKAGEAVSALNSLGIDRVCMFTGEKREPSEAAAGSIGISEVYSDLRADEIAGKLQAMTDMQPNGDTLVYVGTGTSDVELLKAANVGVKLGGYEPEEGYDACDVAVISADPAKVPLAVKTAVTARRNIRLALIVGGVIKLFVLVLGLTGVFPAWAAPLADAVIAAITIFMCVGYGDAAPNDSAQEHMHISQESVSNSADSAEDKPERGFGRRRSAAPEPLAETTAEDEIGIDIERAIEQQFGDMPDVLPSYDEQEDMVQEEIPEEPEEKYEPAEPDTSEEPQVEPLDTDPEPEEVHATKKFQMPPVPERIEGEDTLKLEPLEDTDGQEDMEFDIEDILNEFKDQ